MVKNVIKISKDEIKSSKTVLKGSNVRTINQGVATSNILNTEVDEDSIEKLVMSCNNVVPLFKIPTCEALPIVVPNIKEIFTQEDMIKELYSKCQLLPKKGKAVLQKIVMYEIDNIYKIANSYGINGGGYKSLLLPCIEYIHDNQVFQYSCICKKEGYMDKIIQMCRVETRNNDFKILSVKAIVLSNLVFARILTAFLMSLSETLINSKRSYFSMNSVNVIKLYKNLNIIENSEKMSCLVEILMEKEIKENDFIYVVKVKS